MSDFVVSALKYRPQDFNTVVGQEHITTTLKNAIKNDHLAHSFLFCGPRGVGKTSTARILAKVINCENLSDDVTTCDECASCKAFDEHASYNIYELDAASNNSVDDIRTLIDGVRFAPQRGAYKVYIIDEVHMLSNQAFNAFLKTLEEPPSHAIFILATTEKHKIIPTILSRCQIFDFKRIKQDDTISHLKEICSTEDISYDEDALQVIAQKSEGCMRDALSLMDKLVSFNQGKLNYDDVLENLNILDYDYFFDLGELFRNNNTAEMLVMVDQILDKGFEESIVVEGLLQHYRNLLVSKNPASNELIDTIDSVKERYQNTAKETSLDFILTAMQILSDTLISLKNSSHKRLLTETQLIKLTHLGQLFRTAPETQGLKQEHAYITPRLRKIPSAFDTPRKETRLKIDKSLNKPNAETQSKEPSDTPTVKKATSPPKERTNKPKTYSLSQLSQKKEEAKETNVLDEIQRKQKPLTQENIENCWKKFIVHYGELDPGITHEILSTNTLKERDGKAILVCSPSKSAQSTFKSRKIIDQIIAYFRDELSHVNILFEYELDLSQKKETKTYKNKHKQLEELEEKYPKLKELKTKLGLDLF